MASDVALAEASVGYIKRLRIYKIYAETEKQNSIFKKPQKLRTMSRDKNCNNVLQRLTCSLDQ